MHDESSCRNFDEWRELTGERKMLGFRGELYLRREEVTVSGNGFRSLPCARSKGGGPRREAEEAL
jgi:hypothetical protein